jgi:hypothetical protein
MTAEVAVLNKSAVALAADSAVTIQGASGQKIYNSINKLFGLSKYEPVGVMVYGSADLNGVPWDTIIKMFRRHLGTSSFDNLEGYANALKAYLTNNDVLFPTAAQEATVRDMLYSAFSQMTELAERRAKAKKESIPITLEVIARALQKRLTSSAFLTGYSEGDLDTVLDRHSVAVDQAWNEVFSTPEFSEDLTALLRRVAALCLCKAHRLYEPSGVVIAGFGQKEVFPTLVCFEVYYVSEDQPRLGDSDSYRCTLDNAACVFPFAQRDLVTTFMEGVDPRYQEFVETTLSEVLVDHYPDLLAAALAGSDGLDADVLKDKLGEIGRGLVQGLQERMQTHRREEHASRITQAVAFLPKDDLASLAESLVNLTSLRKRVTLDPETVGGAIDVVVISKGDGLVWMKRKHYFKAELNPHFFTNYFREGKDA